jgi:hypothetical protein
VRAPAYRQGQALCEQIAHGSGLPAIRLDATSVTWKGAAAPIHVF